MCLVFKVFVIFLPYRGALVNQVFTKFITQFIRSLSLSSETLTDIPAMLVTRLLANI